MHSTITMTSALGAVALAAALAGAVPASAAITAKVREACSYDYRQHCPKYEPSSPQARQCMSKVGKRLTPGCIDALRDAGEIKGKR